MISGKARSLLSNDRFGENFEAEVAFTTCYSVNRSPSPTIGYKTSQRKWSGKPADSIGLRVYDSSAYAHVSEGMLESMAKRCILLGHAHSKVVSFHESTPSH